MVDELEHLCEDYIKIGLQEHDHYDYIVNMYMKYNYDIFARYYNILVQVEKITEDGIKLYESACSVTLRALNIDCGKSIEHMLDEHIKVLSTKIINDESIEIFTKIDDVKEQFRPIYDVI